MEKRKPHHDLGTIKAEFSTVTQGMNRQQFYKSMTSQWSSAVWQNVYHVPHESTVLYVKFTTDAQGQLLISFKEK